MQDMDEKTKLEALVATFASELGVTTRTIRAVLVGRSTSQRIQEHIATRLDVPPQSLFPDCYAPSGARLRRGVDPTKQLQELEAALSALRKPTADYYIAIKELRRGLNADIQALHASFRSRIRQLEEALFLHPDRSNPHA